jgi:hypothetical protein
MMQMEAAIRRAIPFVASCLLAVGCAEPAGPSGISVTVTGITPASGSTSGGTPVTITGTNFTAGATITIGGAAASQVSLSGPTTLTAVTGSRGAGTVDVVVTINGSSATLPAGFTYVAPTGSNSAPTIHSMRAQGSRTNQPASFADLGEAIAISATVSDPETPSGSLLYEWSAPVGSFEGSGAAVTWRAPQSFATPGTVALKLTVVDRY